MTELTREQVSDVLDAIEEARALLDGQIDVVDGDYGVPRPNTAMRTCQKLDAAQNVMDALFVTISRGGRVCPAGHVLMPQSDEEAKMMNLISEKYLARVGA